MTTQPARIDAQARRAGIRRTVWIFALLVTVIYVGMLWRGFAG